MKKDVGLVLMSGGARGAYQSGALKALAEITGANHSPFTILSGTSAGSINCAYLACHANRFQAGINELNSLWYNIHPENIFDLNPLRSALNAALWAKDLGLGGTLGSVHGRSLLSTEPLHELLKKNLDMDRIEMNEVQGLLKAVCITATNYYSGLSVTFIEALNHISGWTRKNSLGVLTKLNVNHVMASSAMPYFFPAIRIDHAYYGDGCIRLHNPLYPAIQAGAEKIIAIGVRNSKREALKTDLNSPFFVHYPQFAELGGVILNALFLDSLEEDVAKANEINLELSLKKDSSRLFNSHRKIPVFLMTPSVDLDSFARKASKGFPKLIRHLMRGIGISGDQGWNLLSYLAFDSSYTRRLVELGYQDTMSLKSEIQDFIAE